MCTSLSNRSRFVLRHEIIVYDGDRTTHAVRMGSQTPNGMFRKGKETLPPAVMSR